MCCWSEGGGVAGARTQAAHCDAIPTGSGNQDCCGGALRCAPSIVGPRTSGPRQVLELLDVQQLVAKAAEERFGETVLPRRPWLDVEQLQADSFTVTANGTGDELWSIVAADVLGTPRVRNKFVSTSTIRSALMLRSTSKAKHSRVYSSVIANHFNGRPALSDRG